MPAEDSECVILMDQDQETVQSEANTDESAMNSSAPEKVVVWCDGCYDMVHFGHANSLRQAKELGDSLIVGVHSDEEIEHHKKCRPVFTAVERYEMVRAIKWVDEVIENAPYVTTVKTLDEQGCDFCAHGNDITTTADGKDTYQEVKDVNRYKEVERTQGVSTTDLVARILRNVQKASQDQEELDENSNTVKISSPYTGKSPFLPTTRKIMQFSNGNKTVPKPGQKVVYVDGSFDVFHPGHLAFLRAAKSKVAGSFLIVGLYDDSTIQGLKGEEPLVRLHERALSVLACRFVDEVVIGSPYLISQDLLSHLKVSLVLHGQTEILPDPHTSQDPYGKARQRGIFKEINSGSTLTTNEVIQRVANNVALYQKRNEVKQKKELNMMEASSNLESEQ